MDLREYYITPMFLENLKNRARKWTEEFIEEQMRWFEKTIPDYPEVNQILESELHRRDLNRLHKSLREKSTEEIESILRQVEEGSDSEEVLKTELQLRNGVKRLSEINPQG